LIANRHVDLAPAPVQRSRSRSMDRSCHSSGISAFSRIRSESNATVPARPRRDVFRRSDPLIANRHVDLAPAPVQRPRSRSMDRSCHSSGICHRAGPTTAFSRIRSESEFACSPPNAGPTTTRCLSQERSIDREPARRSRTCACSTLAFAINGSLLPVERDIRFLADSIRIQCHRAGPTTTRCFSWERSIDREPARRSRTCACSTLAFAINGSLLPFERDIRFLADSIRIQCHRAGPTTTRCFSQERSIDREPARRSRTCACNARVRDQWIAPVDRDIRFLADSIRIQCHRAGPTTTRCFSWERSIDREPARRSRTCTCSTPAFAINGSFLHTRVGSRRP
jgi:hypothetical protein